MKRDYDNGTSEDVKFFVGTEIEHTPAYGLETLFVTGIHPIWEIEEKLAYGIKHIFFGANHSFNPVVFEEWRAWEDMISHFLKKGYLCSLDIPISVVEEFNDGCLNEYINFIPQIRVPVPCIKLWNYNTMLKIDDKGFNSTNPGVWTHSLHTLMDRSVFTTWSQYKNDKVIG
jgi:hypothetical protein